MMALLGSERIYPHEGVGRGNNDLNGKEMTDDWNAWKNSGKFVVVVVGVVG